MPTLNSEKTIKLALDSIKKQTYRENLIEILVIDGGSKDRTREIAKEYGCRILENPKMQPECAKHIGILNAKGKYAVLLDSDEVLMEKQSLEKKVDILENFPEVKNILTAGLLNPPNFSFVNDYKNRFGEPFSFFMYGIDGGDYVPSLKKKYKVYFENEKFIIFEFSNKDILPIVDGGAHFFNLDYFKKIADIENPGVILKIFNIMSQETRKLAIVKNDFVVHYSTTGLKNYIEKLKWRIIGNIHYNCESGRGAFWAREKLQPGWFRFKKYLFIPFSFSVILPLYASIYLAVSKKQINFILHFPLTVYTAGYIIYQYFFKLINIKPQLKSYGK
jgi:glycosyltransferase involved in cell wall biosynthesis